MASQTNSLVSQDSPALNSLLKSLHSDLTVVGQHQEDLAEGVSYLGGALKGFQSIAYSGSSARAVGQHLRQPGVAHQHVRRHRALRGVRRGAEPGARAGPRVVQRPDGPVAGRGLEHRLRGAGSSSPSGSSSSAATPSSTSTTSGSSGSSPVRRRQPDRAELRAGWALPADQPAVAGGRMMGRAARAALTSKVVRFAVAGCRHRRPRSSSGVEVTKGAPTYPINVVYSSAPGPVHRCRRRRPRRQGGNRHRRAERR